MLKPFCGVWPWTPVAALAAAAVVVAQATRISIDVAPGDSPTVIEAGRGGMLPVAVLSTATFDAATVDPTTIRFGTTDTQVDAFRTAAEDVDRDGRIDLLVLVRITDLQLPCGETVLHLRAQTQAGAPLEGSETVTVVGCSPG